MTIIADNIQTPVWMDTNLQWNPKFWKSLKAKTLMRLNPHWHLDKKTEAGTPVEDMLVDKKFLSEPILSFEQNIFKADFPETGLSISARMDDNGGSTSLRYDFTPVADSKFTTEDAQKTVQYWLPSLREYYRLHQSNSVKHRFWRFFMDKIMLTMNPTQRRICSFMFKLTMLEILFVTALIIGWHFYGG
ncbi:hypothetical protein [Maridesulfovibrio hydrothermalis]|nr:hypothetical protein [Maridesulfovibrio hydrothermalis]